MQIKHTFNQQNNFYYQQSWGVAFERVAPAFLVVKIKL